MSSLQGAPLLDIMQYAIKNLFSITPRSSLGNDFSG